MASKLGRSELGAAIALCAMRWWNSTARGSEGFSDPCDEMMNTGMLDQALPDYL